jgi:hypothetical protein
MSKFETVTLVMVPAPVTTKSEVTVGVPEPEIVTGTSALAVVSQLLVVNEKEGE